MTDDISVDLLGPLQVVRSGETVVFSAPMQRALLAFLALDPGRAAPVDAIVDALWERPPGQAVNMVQQLVSALRRRLSSQAVTTRGRAYQLQLEPGAVDYARFTDLTRTAAEQSRAGRHDRAARALETALGLWRGTPLLDLPASPFVDRARVAMQHEREQAQLAYLKALLTEGRPAEALPALEHIVHERPLDEGAAELLVRALGQSGRQADALDVYEATRRRLVDELGLDPGPGLAAAQQAVLHHELAPVADVPSVLPRRRLPRPRTSLIGRDGVLDQMRQLFAQGTPLVTVTGPGGVGKTRVALAYAARSLERGLVFFVDLAPLSDPQQVLVEIAAAIGLADYDRKTLPDQVARMVAGTSTLLVLDNFEHLLEAADELASLLEALEPDTRVLVTSRGPLRITGERVLVLNPLSAIAPTSDDGHGSISTAPAVALYRERTEAAHPGFLKHTSDAAIAELCQRLDGLPLAIELAAARADLAPPELLLSNLNKRLALLGTGPRDAPPRHHTLQACIDWSVEQLSEPARALFGVLAVFAGGATVRAVSDVCSAVLGDLDVTAALDELAAHHLTRVEPTEAGPRITMLDTIHDRAWDQLETAELRRPTKSAHARHYLSIFAEAPTNILWPPTTSTQARRWCAELPNARVALQTLQEQGRVRDAARLTIGLWPLWLLRGERDEAATWLRWIAGAVTVAPEERAHAMLRLAHIATVREGAAQGAVLLRHAAETAGSLPDASVQVHLAYMETFVAFVAGDPVAAARAQQRAYEVAAASNDPELVALIGTLPPQDVAPDGLLASAGELMRYAKETENEVLMLAVETNYAEMAVRTGDPILLRRGQQWAAQAATRSTAFGDIADFVAGTSNAAACSLLLGEDPLTAARQFAVTLDTAIRIGDTYAGLDTLPRMAAALSAAGAPREAAGLAAAAERLAAARGASLISDNAVLAARFLNQLPDLLGPDAYEEAVVEWETDSWEEAARKAVQLPQLSAPSAN